MKKFYLIIFLITIVQSGLAQFLQKPREVHKHYTYYDDDMPVEANFKGRFSYNSFGQIQMYEEIIGISDAGTNYYVWKYWYDNSHRLIKTFYSGYDGGGLFGIDSTFYVYDGDLLDYSKELHINKWGVWYYTDSTAYFYDDNNDLVRIEGYGTTQNYQWATTPNTVTEYVRTEEGLEINKTRYWSGGMINDLTITHYDSEDHMLDYLYELYRGQDYPILGDKKQYQYVNGLCQTMTYQKWNSTDTSWVNNTFEIYQFNDLGMKTEAVSMAWVDGEWYNSEQTLWEFDVEGSCQSITYKNWEEDEFINFKKVSYAYDEKGYCVGLSGIVWSGEDWIEGIGGRNEPVFWDESLKQENDLIESGNFSFSDVTVSWQTIYPELQQGSEWYYEIQNEDGSITYQHLEYAADTTVNEKKAKVIVRTNQIYDKERQTEVTHEYVYEEYGKVYWWNKDLQEFTVLYDLAANAGDEWEIKVGEESLIMHVDTVLFVEHEGCQYRMLRVSDEQNVFSGDILCAIGHLTSFFPERLMNHSKLFRVEGLRCYWLDGSLFFQNGDLDCDAIYEQIHHGLDETADKMLMVYPNPTDGLVHVEACHGPALQEYRITNLMGQTLLSGSVSDQPIDVSSLPVGLYFLTLDQKTVKLIKQ